MKVKAASLIFDYTLYPRQKLISQNVASLAEALRAGAKLPPVVIDKKTRRIVDGFHRTYAYLQVFGPDVEIEVIAKDYATDAELFEDAMRLNGSHGCRLSPFDLARCAIRAGELGIPPKVLAAAVNMTEVRLQRLVADRSANDESGGVITLKRTVRHISAEVLTDLQRDAAARTSGLDQLFYVNQVINLIDGDILDRDNEHLVSRLHYLQGRLGEVLH